MKVLPLLHTVPIVLVGVKRSDFKDKRANYTTIGDVAIAGLNPALLMISLHEIILQHSVLRERVAYLLMFQTGTC